MTVLTDLTDRHALTDLVARLTRWLDDSCAAPALDGEGLRAVYSEDATVRSPRGGARGVDAVLEYVRRTTSPGEHTQHFTTDVLVDLDGDRADVTANLLVYLFRPGQAPHRTVGLRYAFTAARLPGGWRFTRAEITPAWFQGT
ncbi:nuclear transport factor 2 family protein [Streptosporangium sp. NPDC023615]|uniref:nuclear transport factor 2 family protein n=1 Tax=Streptosporangium sp. NPDC023615 TaxID=3154794 RepID=UPI0034341819